MIFYNLILGKMWHGKTCGDFVMLKISLKIQASSLFLRLLSDKVSDIIDIFCYK